MQNRIGIMQESKPLKCFFIQSAFGAAFTYLTSGIFLSGLAILMGAGDVLVSYLSVIVNICGVLIVAISAFLERFTILCFLPLHRTGTSLFLLHFLFLLLQMQDL